MSDYAQKWADELMKASNGVVKATETVMRRTGNGIVNAMRANLQRNGSIDTGALFNSCRQETERDGDTITTRIYADAVSEDGTPYAEFLEFGTGIHNEKGDGRKTPWSYYKDGQWHTTRGMTPRPFIRPAVAANARNFAQGMEMATSIDKYKHLMGGDD